MNRKQQQAELIFKLGQFVGPLLKLIENVNDYDSDERERIRARFNFEKPKMHRAIHEFAEGEEGHAYGKQSKSALEATHHMLMLSQTELDQIPVETIRALYLEVINSLLAIPIPVDSTVHDAKTPFSTYCLLKDLCSTVRTEVVWLDRYFDQTIFHRFFVDVPATARVTLVTWPRSKFTSTRDQRRYDELMDVSRMFATERGHGRYRLITDEMFHDRWLRCDEKMFSLGGSIKDIGKATTFTIARLDSTPENRSQFDAPITAGVEVFGSACAVHP